MSPQETAAAAKEMDEDELLDSTVELINAYKAIKDPTQRKELRDFALYLAEGRKIQ